MLLVQLNRDGTPAPEEKLHPRSVLAKILHSAQFWELSNIRTALLTCLNAHITFLDGVDVQKLTSKKSKKTVIEADKQRGVIAVYELLLLVPTDYLPRASRQDFLRRAQVADIVFSKILSRDIDAQSWALTVLRTFQQRWFSYQSASDHEVSSLLGMYESCDEHKCPAGNASISTTSYTVIWSRGISRQAYLRCIAINRPPYSVSVNMQSALSFS